jgi:hypothetical protein
MVRGVMARRPPSLIGALAAALVAAAALAAALAVVPPAASPAALARGGVVAATPARLAPAGRAAAPQPPRAPGGLPVPVTAALAVWGLGLVSVVVAARRRLEDVGDGWRALLLGAPPAVA